jgi:hypothetical protein
LGKKDGGSQTVTTQPDAGTQAYINQMRQLALGYAGIGQPGGTGASTPAWANGPNPYGHSLLGDVYGQSQQQAGRGAPLSAMTPPPLPPGIQQAIGQYGQYANAGQQGLAALTGNAGAQQQFMNPYQHNLDPYWAQAREQALGSANEQATLAGAFGGGRNDVTQGVALSGIAQAQGMQQYQAFLEAMQRAQGAAGMGLGAIGAGAFLPQQYQSGQLGLLQQALGPTGQTQTQQMQRDPWSQLLGLGLTAGGFLLGGPAGAAAGSGASGSLGG